jgi:putative transcriptional regulator
VGRRDGRIQVAPSVKNRLKVLRAELAWSQADLSERLGVSRQTVNAIETGKYDPSLPLAFSLARTFRRQIEEIFEAEGIRA